MSREAPLILLVDDDEDFIEINRLILEAEGYRVAGASDAKEAWERMEREAPALVVTDLMMASMDAGFSFARQIKEDPRFRGVPVVLATAASSRGGFDFHPRGPEELAAMGVDAYFDKPIPPTRLVEKVAQLLARGAG